jgi:hypothetical protein
MAATTAEKRAWLRAQGYDVSVKGSLSDELEAAYDAAHPSANGDAGRVEADEDFDLSAVDFAADPPEDTGETAPKRPRATGKPAAGKTSRTWPWAKKTAAKGKAKPKHPRIPVDDVISGGWRLLARVARPVPPLERTLKVQSPVAGLLLEDTIKGTALDTVLQPIARMQAQGKVVAALAGPPLLVTAGTLHMQRAAATGTEPNPVFMAVITEALRESLMLWMDVAGPKFEAALAKEREFEEHYGQNVDQMIAWIFSPPPDPRDAAAVAAEDDAIKRAQGILKE